MSLFPVLVHLQLTEYEPKLTEEMIDLHAATLLSPSDIRSFVGVPLGLAAKLICVAQETYALQPFPRSSTLHPQTQESMCHMPSTGTPQPAQNIDSPREMAELMRPDGVDTLPSDCSTLCSAFRRAWSSSWNAGTCLTDMFYPPDHTSNFQRQAIIAKSSTDLKNFMMNLAGNWVMVLCFFSNWCMSVLPLIPADATPVEKLLLEGFIALELLLVLSAITAWSVLAVCTDAVSVSNIKTFLTGSIGCISATQYLLMASFYLMFASFFFLSYIRMRSALKFADEQMTDFWPRAFVYGTLCLMVTCFLFASCVIKSLGRLAHNGCLMCEKDWFPKFSSAASMEEGLSNDAWGQAMNCSQSHAPVDYAFKFQARKSIVVEPASRSGQRKHAMKRTSSTSSSATRPISSRDITHYI